MSYVTLTEFKASLELTGFSFADYDAQNALDSASAGIDQYCGRTFTAGSGTQLRAYSPANGWAVNIDDAISVGTVSVDMTGDGIFDTVWTALTDYFLEPYNASYDGVPFEQVQVNRRSAMRFPPWARCIQVEGVFGWPAVPAQVVQATSIMASRIVKRTRETPFGIVGANTLDAQPIRISRVDPDVAFLLDNLIRGSSGEGGVLLA